MNILVTGATGNIGREIIEYFNYSTGNKIFAAVQDVQKNLFTKPVELRAFDFKDLKIVGAAIKDMDIIFLCDHHKSPMLKMFLNQLLNFLQVLV